MQGPSPEQILAGLSPAGRERVRAWVEQNTYDALAVRAETTWPGRRFWQRRGPEFALTRMQSKYGGAPYFEAASEIPRFKGRPFELLAQFELSELPRVPGLPDTGMLVLWVIRGAWTSQPFAVRYYESPSDGRAAALPDDLKLDRRREASVAFEVRRLVTLPSDEFCRAAVADGNFDEMLLPDPPHRMLDEYFYGLGFADDESGNVFLPDDVEWVRSNVSDGELDGRRLLLRLSDDWSVNFEVGPSSLYVTMADDEGGSVVEPRCFTA